MLNIQNLSRECQVAWAAGLFEGEGCMNLVVRPRQGRAEGDRLMVQVRLGSTDEEIVKAFQAVMECGNVHTPRTIESSYGSPRANPVKQPKKTFYDWSAANAVDVAAVINLLLPFFGSRRKQRAEEVLEGCRQIGERHQDKQSCPQGHPLEGDNLLLENISRTRSDGTVKEYKARRCKACRQKAGRDRARSRLGVEPENYRV